MIYLKILAVLVLCTFIFAPLSYSENNAVTEEERFLFRYFQFLKNGNVKGILNSLADPILSEKKAILQKNRAYARFLIHNYEDSVFRIRRMKSFRINRIDSVGYECRSVDAEIFAGADQVHSEKIRFLLKRDNKGQWKIYQEIYDFD